jgi:alpha-beta hydrolase superfamily lysophospholipase
MLVQKFTIGHIPAILYGAESNKVYLFIHGKDGCKEDAAGFAEAAIRAGWQVLGTDLPEHGERKSGSVCMLPWNVVPELQSAMAYAKQHWSNIAVCANSIGAWFSMLSFTGEPIHKCLFVSPILDMEKLIHNMMLWAQVSQEQLQREGQIPTAFGETLSWEYLSYVRSHPITDWNAPTSILYADHDNLTDRATAEAFAKRHHANLTIMENGEHWFHTPEQLAFLKQWIERELNLLRGE